MLAPAKLNLYLHVTGKRPDGYHLLDSLITFIDIYDTVQVLPASDYSLTISGEFAPLVTNDAQNIVTRAYHLMAQECGINAGASIMLEKNIPVGAGLGGGSSDAATTLLLLNELWQAGLSGTELAALGLRLGADVPIFIHQKPGFISGIGDKITTATGLPQFYILLVYPRQALSTREVFCALDLPSEVASPAPQPTLTTPAKWLKFLQKNHNDLEQPASAIMPQLTDIIRELSTMADCQLARMSGSGSTCFAIFSSQAGADSALAQFSRRHPTYWLRLCHNVGT